MQLGEGDLQRSIDLFKKEDFGNAAFHMQQGLEKYLKSYWLKTNFIQEVQRLGHLQYSEILNETISIFEEQRKEESEEQIVKTLDAIINHFRIIGKIFLKVQNSNAQKILFWKKSLNIPLTKKEQDVLNGIYTQMQNSSTKFLRALTSYLTSEPFFKSFKKKKIPYEMKSKIPHLLLQYVNALKSGNSAEVQFIFQRIMNLFRTYQYGTGPQSLTKEESDFMIKMKVIDTALGWYEYVLLTYPHQEFGRYPTLVDGKESMLLYKENKSELIKLILSVRMVCNRIKSSMQSSDF